MHESIQEMVPQGLDFCARLDLEDPLRKKAAAKWHTVASYRPFDYINSLKSFLIDKSFDLNPKLLIDLWSTLVDITQIEYHFRILGIKHEFQLLTNMILNC